MVHCLQIVTMFVLKYILTIINISTYRDIESVTQLVNSGSYENIALRGNTPSTAYQIPLIDGLIDALTSRFDLQNQFSVQNATSILYLKNWPSSSTSPNLQGSKSYMNVVCMLFS